MTLRFWVEQRLRKIVVITSLNSILCQSFAFKLKTLEKHISEAVELVGVCEHANKQPSEDGSSLNRRSIPKKKQKKHNKEFCACLHRIHIQRDL